MRAGKRIIAFIITVCMVLTSAAPYAQAQELQQGIQEPEAQGEGNALPGQEGQAQEPKDGVQELTEEEAREKGVLQFLMQESESVPVPGSQNVVAGLGQEGTVLEGASLQYVHTGTGQEFTVEAQGISGNMARFSMEYTEEGQTGVYALKEISYQAGGQGYRVVLADEEMEVVYGVGCQAQGEPDEVLLNQALLDEVEANVVTMDENGNVASSQSLEDVLGEKQGEGESPLLRMAPKGAKEMVIILDPGHDSTHAGAGYYGYKEQDLVVKIALYCREELQKYGGISIFMTRDTKACPFGGSSVDSGTCNARRVEFAQSKKADVYVSFHLNASPSSSARGVGVYYPNSNYRKDVWEEGKGLATSIYQKLAALGLSTWADGIVIRNSENNTTYPDGSLADYLAIIRRSKLAGFPAVLIEHAFLSNASDVSGFLNSDAKLKRLGVADAQAIVSYYQLSQQGTEPRITGAQSRGSEKLRITWETVKNAESYEVYRSDAKNGAYTKIATVAGDTYDDTKLDAQKEYYYKVRAVFSDGEVSEDSNVYAASPLAKPQVASVVSKSSGRLCVSWGQVEGASKYEVYRSDAQDGSYKKIAVVNGQDEVSYMDGNIEMQKDYYYKVRARGGDANGFGGYSNVLSGWAIQPSEIVSVSSKTSTSLLVRWKKVPNIYAYRIQRSTSAKKGYATVATIKSGDTISYVDKKLKKGITYYYRILAINRVNGKNGVSSYSKPVGESTISPTSIQYVRSKNSKSMEIKWVRDPNAYLYRIKRSDKENGTYVKVADVKGNKNVTYVDTSISPGKKYYYAVQTIAKKNKVNNYSSNSAPVGRRNLGSVNVKSLYSQNNGIQITWEAVTSANGYQIVRSDNKKGPYKQVVKLKGKSSLVYTDTNVEVGKPYYYKVRALRTGTVTGYGSYTGAKEKWMLDSPKGVKVSSQRADRVKLSWSKKTGADGYQILRSTKEASGYQVVGAVSAEKTTYTDTAVLPNKTYYYKVTATGSWGLDGLESEPAPVVGSTAVEATAVTSITAKADGGIVLELKGVSGAHGYEIRRSKEEGRDFQVIGEASQGTTFIDHDVEEGSTYYYKVRTIWMVGDKKYYSGYSDVCTCSFSFVKNP